MPRWEVTTHVAQQGDNFSISCTVPGVTLFNIVRITKEDRDSEESHDIADRQHLKSPFLETKRYNVTYSLDHETSTATCTLSYRGVKGEDEGRLSCYKLTATGNEPKAYLDLNVHAPVKDLYITMVNVDGSHTRVPEGEILTLTEEVEGGMGCVATVEGSMTVPDMRIFIGQEEQNTETFVPEPLSEEDNPGALPTWTSQMTRTYTSSMPDPNFNGKTLRCEAEMEGFEPRTVSNSILVQYSPRVTCQRYKYFTTLEGTVEMVCDVKGSPAAEISWSRTEEERDPQNIEPEEQLNFTTEDISDDHRKTTLYIKSAGETQFGDYYLHTHNDLATKVVPLTLTQSANPMVETMPNEEAKDPNNPEPHSVHGSGVRNVAALCHVLLVVMVTALFNVMSR